MDINASLSWKAQQVLYTLILRYNFVSSPKTKAKVSFFLSLVVRHWTAYLPVSKLLLTFLASSIELLGFSLVFFKPRLTFKLLWCQTNQTLKRQATSFFSYVSFRLEWPVGSSEIFLITCCLFLYIYVCLSFCYISYSSKTLG